MFYLVRSAEQPDGFVHLSTAAAWERWLRHNLSERLDAEVRRRLVSNLKHILVGLEMKAALIAPHHRRGNGRSVLFEPYFQTLIFEFCVGVFSLAEGLGSAHWFVDHGHDGRRPVRVLFPQWQEVLVREYDPEGEFDLAGNLQIVKQVRDTLHQDKIGLRSDIDWHDFSHDAAYQPAARALRRLLQRGLAAVPASSNLHADAEG